MKIFEWNIGMAATVPSNQGYILMPWVIDEIMKDSPDCIVLTEFVVSKGIDYYFNELEKNKYHWFISATTKSNGILIALKEDSFEFEDTFDYEKLSIHIGNEVLSGCALPDFYEIQVKWNGQPLSIIGVRIKWDITGENASYKISQFQALDGYLAKQKHNVICIGDFNAYWGKNWLLNNITLPNTALNNFELHTPPYQKGVWHSFVQSDGKLVQLDHLITNIRDRRIIVEYDWEFINSLRYKNGITSKTANKPNGIPDHAILKAIL